MPRSARVDVGNEIYHIINRANGRLKIFNKDEDFQLFEQLLYDTKELFDMRILAYCLMPNHFHLVLYPKNDGDMGKFMHRLSNSHTRKVHAITNTNGSGHLYQGRYKSFLVDKENYIIAVIKYVERNSVRAKLTRLCQNWQWGSAWRRTKGTIEQKKLLDQKSFKLPDNYLSWINTEDNSETTNIIRRSVKKGIPYGRDKWIDNMVSKYHLESTLKSQGRPRKKT
ncbi:MAG: transposase [Patescibacteria group bacterium]